MGVSVQIPSTLREFTGGQRVIEAEGQNIGQCLEDMERQFPGIKRELCDEEGRLFTYIRIYINGEMAYPEELTMSVNAGDELIILPAITGG
jgi:MoaD family protein